MTLQEVFDAYDTKEPVKFELHELSDGTEVTLVNDGQQCWLAKPESLKSAMVTEITVPELDDEIEVSVWAYEVLCNKVRHQAKLEEAFEADFGTRNWP
jgi:hypothetical protein